MERQTNNDLSGRVAGHVVQADTVHGDVVLHGPTPAQIEDSRALRDERLTSYAKFLEIAESVRSGNWEMLTASNRWVEVSEKRASLPRWGSWAMKRHYRNSAVRDLKTLLTLKRDLPERIVRLVELEDTIRVVGPMNVCYSAAMVTQSAAMILDSCGFDVMKMIEDKEAFRSDWEIACERHGLLFESAVLRFRDAIRCVREAPLL
ncbi:hypothetical protein ACF06W_18465 [Streptomyces albus]|uniref:hypothetical protein n=1 Tax=Streptomyces albus TaxID=1888 RepID=UPI0036F9756F